jgi:Cu/Ag efflux protein CusF
MSTRSMLLIRTTADWCTRSALAILPCGATRSIRTTIVKCSFVPLGVLLFTGCPAAYELPPLTTAHPANPEAMAAPEQPLSNTLAYGPLDIPSPQPASTSYMAQHGMPGSHPSQEAAQHTFVGEGKIIAVVPSTRQVVIDHAEIKGLMGAMTMGYQVNSSSLLDGLNAGDRIRFTIEAEQKAIVKIEKIQE